MKKKRNKRNISLSIDRYIKKYFGTDIGRILMPGTRNLQNCEIPYVSHEEAEAVLKDSLVGDPLMDKSRVFTGLTGSGKTTILRHVFGLETNANKVIIQGNTLIIPIDFNRSQKSAQDAILSSLRVAVQKVVDTYNIDFPDTTNIKFSQYIAEIRPDVLKLDAKQNNLTTYQEKMTTFLEDMPTAFASCQLQYVMDQEKCKLDLVVLIVDNIEAFMDQNAKNSKSRYLTPVIEAFHLAECIDQRGKSTKWCFNMLIACRHHIWRIMKGEYSDNSQESALLQSYVTTEKPYDLANPVDVNSIIEKREEVFSRRQNDPQKWNVAVDVVDTILRNMDNTIGDFVLQLGLKDLRKSMKKMKELVLHKGLQRKSDEEIEGVFQISSVEQFDLTRVNLVKVIGLDDKKYYADTSSIIPNLLYNRQDEDVELYLLLTLKYFLIQCGFMEPAWDNPVSIDTFYAKMKYIFEFDAVRFKLRFKKSVHYLLEHRLLLRSADQSQDEVPGLSSSELDNIEKVYVSGAAVKLWEELGKSSALFQLFLDDVWLDDESEYFDENGNDIEHCVKYLEILKQKEHRIYNNADNNSLRAKKAYIEAFGVTPICSQLVDGLIASLETISTSVEFALYSRISAARETLKKANKLSDDLRKWEKEREKYE